MLGSRGRWVIPGAILLVALAVRVGYVLATPGYRMIHDDRAYDHLALGIAGSGAYPDVGGYATAYRPPAFPYLLGAVYAVTGRGHDRVVAGRLMQALLGVAIVALIGAVTARLLGRRAALGSMALAAVYVPMVAAGTSLLSEPLTIVFELLAVLAVLAWRTDGRMRWLVAAGAASGAMTLCRSNAFVVLIALALGAAVVGRRLRAGGLKAAAVLLFTALAVVAPWTIRNAVVMHAFIPVSDEAGGTLAGTYNPVSAHDPNGPGFWRLLVQIPQYRTETRALASGPEYAFQQRLVHLAADYVRRHPLYPLQVAAWNTKRILGLNSLRLSQFTASVAGVTSPAVADAGVYSFWAIGALAAIALGSRDVRRWVPTFVWLAAALLYISIVFVNSEAPRLRLPLDPFVLLLAGAGIERLIRGTLGRRHVDDPQSPQPSAAEPSAADAPDLPPAERLVRFAVRAGERPPAGGAAGDVGPHRRGVGDGVDQPAPGAVGPQADLPGTVSVRFVGPRPHQHHLPRHSYFIAPPGVN